VKIRSKATAAALVAAAAGTIVTLTVLPGSAQIGAPNGTVPSPVPSLTAPSGIPTTVPPDATPPALTLEMATSNRYGTILVTPAGQTVYRPLGGCACDPGYHPLLAVPGQPLQLPVQVTGRLGTVKLPDGSQQLTFDGSPLYLFSGDHVQGDTNGVALHWRIIEVGL
jgi:predicted lipoprotein with Yx(FWY)xxD motif